VDPHHVKADPDANLDPTFHPDADPDPDLSFQIKAQTLEKSAKIGSYSIHFVSSSANWCGLVWCESGSEFLFDADADPDADPGYQNDPDPQN
jgi:hypothetical protein